MLSTYRKSPEPARWRALSPPRLLLINALIRAGAAASGQLFAFLLAERLGARPGAGALLVGLLGAAYFVTELAGAPFAGRIADLRGQRRVLAWGPLFGAASAIVASAAWMLGASVPALAVFLFVARLTEGASAACAVPTTLVLLSRATEGDAPRRTRVMGGFEITSLLGMIAGFIVAGITWDALGPAAFLLLAPIYGLAWLVVRAPRGSAGVAREAPYIAAAPGRSRPSVVDTVRLMAARPGNIAFAVSWLGVNAVVGAWVQQAPFLFKLPEAAAGQALVGGFSGQRIGWIFAVWSLTFLAGIALWSVLAADWPRRRAMIVALFGMLGVTGALFAVNHGAPGWTLAIAALFVLVESGFTPAAFAHLADATKAVDPSRGVAFGLYSLLLGTGQLAGNLLGAPFVARWRMDGLLAFTALLALVSLVGIAGMRRSDG